MCAPFASDTICLVRCGGGFFWVVLVLTPFCKWVPLTWAGQWAGPHVSQEAASACSPCPPGNLAVARMALVCSGPLPPSLTSVLAFSGEALRGLLPCPYVPAGSAAGRLAQAQPRPGTTLAPTAVQAARL